MKHAIAWLKYGLDQNNLAEQSVLASMPPGATTAAALAPLREVAEAYGEAIRVLVASEAASTVPQTPKAKRGRKPKAAAEPKADEGAPESNEAPLLGAP